MEDLVQKARHFATQAHRRIEQRRKYTDKPYEAHLKSVAEIVASVTDDPEMIAAAWLHDTVEDTAATIEDVRREFGTSVAELVESLTDVSLPGDGNRDARKAIDRAHISGASPRAKTVKLADIIDNARDICDHDARFGRVFLGEARLLLTVLDEGEPRMYRRAVRTLDQCAAKLGMPAAQPEAAESAERFIPRAGHPLVSKNRRTLRLFTDAFTAEDIAESLRSFSDSHPAPGVEEILTACDLDVAGVRRDGLVCGYLERDGLGRGPCGEYLRPFSRDQVVEAGSSLSDVIQVLTRRAWCFVEILGDVTAVIGRADMQKPIVRMWLFGIITLTEMDIADRIRARWPGERWLAFLSRGRLEKARALQAERRRRGQGCDLLACLQFAEKAEILLQDPEELAEFGFESLGAAKRVVRDLGSLRDNLAHAQDIVTHDWPQIVRMSRRIEEIAGDVR